jgi:hypothetical protein
MRGGEGLDRVQEPRTDARSSSTRADGHASNVEFAALWHRGDGADDRVRQLGDPERTLCKALRDLIRARGRRAERRRRVKCFELGKSCSQRGRDPLRIVFLGKPNRHRACAFQVTRIKVECCRDERFVKARRVNPTNFLTELMRRNVYRAAVAYGVVAWFLTQLTTQVFPFFEIPNSAVRFVVIALAVGFPIAMLLAWVYEFTASMSLAFSGRLTVLVVAIRQRSNARSFHQTKPCARYNFFRRDAE